MQEISGVNSTCKIRRDMHLVGQSDHAHQKCRAGSYGCATQAEHSESKSLRESLFAMEVDFKHMSYLFPLFELSLIHGAHIVTPPS
jgi:hypothetical protein